MHWSVQVFMVIWLGGVGNATFANPRGDTFFGLLRLALGLIGPHIGFWPEVEKAEVFVVQTLQGEIENPAR